MMSVYIGNEQQTFSDDKEGFRYLRECAKLRVPLLHVFFHKKNSGLTMKLEGNRYVEKPFYPILPFE